MQSFINTENIDNITLNKLHILMEYLERKWSIKKINSHYILKKSNKVKSIIISNNENNNNSQTDKEIYIHIFIHNTLEKGWTIKKKNSQYIFKKKHGNKNEYFTKHFLNDFIANNIQKI
jgi:hypothetical protein